MSQLWSMLTFPWRKAWHVSHECTAGAAFWALVWRGALGMALLPLPLLCLWLARLLNLCSPQRGLTMQERAHGQPLFSSALLARTRVAQSSRLLHAIHRLNGGRPFVCLHVVYPGKIPMDARTWQHELTHVWQHTWMGPWYMVHALAAQWHAGMVSLWRAGRFDDAAAYACDHKQLDTQVTQDHRFVLNPEQQAEVVAAYGQVLSGSQGVSPHTQRRLSHFVPRLLGLTG
jgi:hypothetical protein